MIQFNIEQMVSGQVKKIRKLFKGSFSFYDIKLFMHSYFKSIEIQRLLNYAIKTIQ
jgi:hypothetical protein